MFVTDPSLDSMINVLASQLYAPNNSGGKDDTASMRYALERGLVVTCARFPALERCTTLTISSSVDGALMPRNFHRINTVQRIFGDSLRWPLLPIDPDSLPFLFKTMAEAKHRQEAFESPSRFYTEADTLRLWPKFRPSTLDSTFRVCYYAIDSALSSGSDSMNIEQEYYDKVLWYACFIMSVRRQDWQAAASYMSLFETGTVPVAREEELKR